MQELADQNIFMEYDQMRFIFQHIHLCSPHTSSIGVCSGLVKKIICNKDVVNFSAHPCIMYLDRSLWLICTGVKMIDKLKVLSFILSSMMTFIR